MKFSSPQVWEHFDSCHEKAELMVNEREGSYKALPSEALYTSHNDLLAIFHHPLVQGTFVDLGCGAGRTALLYGALHSDRQSIGIDFEMSRLEVGLNFLETHRLRNVLLFEGDLAACPIPSGDTYFLYFPTGPVLDRILSVLYEFQSFFRLVVIESHGDLIPRLELENWLQPKVEIPLTASRHYPCAKIYERLFVPRDSKLVPFQTSYLEKAIFIKTGEELWIGESQGMEWLNGDRFNLAVPPRTIHWNDVKEILFPENLGREEKLLFDLRRKGEVEIQTDAGLLRGQIRKIIIQPTFQVEICSGEKVEWSRILSIKQEDLCYEISSRS